MRGQRGPPLQVLNVIQKVGNIVIRLKLEETKSSGGPQKGTREGYCRQGTHLLIPVREHHTECSVNQSLSKELRPSRAVWKTKPNTQRTQEHSAAKAITGTWRETFGNASYSRICTVITYSKSKDRPGKVANPARGQLNGENENFPVPFRA